MAVSAHFFEIAPKPNHPLYYFSSYGTTNGPPHPPNNPRMATLTPQTTPEWLPSPPKQPPNGYLHPPNNPRMATLTPQTTPEWLPSPPKQPPNGYLHPPNNPRMASLTTKQHREGLPIESVFECSHHSKPNHPQYYFLFYGKIKWILDG